MSIADQITPDDVRKARFLGTPEQVADQVEPYLAAGVTHVLSYNFAGFVDLRYTELDADKERVLVPNSRMLTDPIKVSKPATGGAV